ncbi:ParB/RepB/Spo0J family partition protein [Streptomyces xiamenensis]|uniref:ParB/RepB/Spo0J family partition protein n=1 Tax=Streptomyces xiamenensis TaxID=408015 RepID=UPI0035E1810B
MTPGGIHDLPFIDGDIIDVSPRDINPNPLNRRLDLHLSDQFVESVRLNGVDTPVGVMFTHVFLEHYPQCAETLEDPTRPYTLGPGHRRRAAALQADLERIPALLRNDKASSGEVESWLVRENKDREGLSPIEEALQLQTLRYRGFDPESAPTELLRDLPTIEAVAERSGYAKGTVSKYLALLRLPEPIRDAVHRGEITFKPAYKLTTVRGADDSPTSEETRETQMRVWALMTSEDLTVEAAANRVKLQQIPTQGAGVVTRETDGPADGDVSPGKQRQRKRPRTAAAAAPKPAAGSDSGDAPSSQTADSGQQSTSEASGDPEARAYPEEEANERRSAACALLVSEEKLAAGDTTRRLVSATLNADRAALKKAHRWLQDAKKGPAVDSPDEYFSVIALGTHENLRRRAAYAIGLAADELRISQPGRKWDRRDVEHVELLVNSRAAYQPTDWERQQIKDVSPGKQDV